MPTSAATGTRQSKPKDEPKAKDEGEKIPEFKSVDDVVSADMHPAVDAVDPSGDGFGAQDPHPPAESADFNDNGLTQVRTRDGRHVNVNAGEKGWEKQVRDLGSES